MDVKLTPQDIKRYNGYIWKFFIGGFFLVVLLITITALGGLGRLPSFRDLENPKSNLASDIISSDNKVLGKFYIENRSSTAYKDISPNAINALIATEDNHFKDHSGIDFWRTFSIIAYNLVGKRQGASTITQQLALNLFSKEDRATNIIARIVQKLKEQIIAVRIEKHYTKEEIITMYLNTVDFGSNSFGIKSAASTYFNTTPAQLTPDQAAVLIQTLKGPTIYSPVRHPNNALSRRNFVLARMADEGFLTDGQAREFQARPLGIDYHSTGHNEGLAPYFRDVLNAKIKNIFSDQNITKPDGTPYDLYRDGLKIYVTIDSRAQEFAEDAQRKYMPDLQNQFNQQWRGVSRWKNIKNFKLLIDQGIARSDRHRELALQGLNEDEIRKNFETPDTVSLFTWKGTIDTIMKPIDSIVYTKMLLRNSMMSMDPTTGYIKAWVGGINHEHFKYDQVKIGKRQVGSTAKPFTYAEAIDRGYSPCMQVDNSPVTIDGWTPRSEPHSTLPGAITLRKALANSQNYVTAFVMKEVTPVPVMELINKMGVSSEVPPYPSICLGTFDASVFDMTGAYSAFANHGIWTEPTYLLKIEDKNGNLLYSFTPQKRQALNDQTAYVMTDMLRSVVDAGTGYRLRYKYKMYNPIGGKTGTTQDNSDGWFIGVTPKLVTGVWTGCEDRDIHFRSTRIGEGANSALPIFALYMQQVYANAALGVSKNDQFAPPKNPLTIELNCDSYNQQAQGTSEVDKKLDF